MDDGIPVDRVGEPRRHQQRGRAGRLRLFDVVLVVERGDVPVAGAFERADPVHLDVAVAAQRAADGAADLLERAHGASVGGRRGWYKEPMPTLRPARDSDSRGVIALIGRVFDEYPGCVLDVEREEPGLVTPASSYDRFWVLEQGGEILGCSACALRLPVQA